MLILFKKSTLITMKNQQFVQFWHNMTAVSYAIDTPICIFCVGLFISDDCFLSSDKPGNHFAVDFNWFAALINIWSQFCVSIIHREYMLEIHNHFQDFYWISIWMIPFHCTYEWFLNHWNPSPSDYVSTRREFFVFWSKHLKWWGTALSSEN